MSTSDRALSSFSLSWIIVAPPSTAAAARSASPRGPSRSESVMAINRTVDASNARSPSPLDTRLSAAPAAPPE
jgi:hypothetical protein